MNTLRIPVVEITTGEEDVAIAQVIEYRGTDLADRPWTTGTSITVHLESNGAMLVPNLEHETLHNPATKKTYKARP